MTYLTSAVGLFYLVAACLVIRRAYAEGRAAVRAPAAPTAPERTRTLLMIVSTGLYGAAGMALLFRSAAAVWLFAAGLCLQGFAYLLLFGQSGAAAQGDGRQWDQALAAAMLSAAATALSAYALRTGILT